MSSGPPFEPAEEMDPVARHPSSFDPDALPSRRSRWVWVAAVLTTVGVLASLFGYGLANDPTRVRSPLIGRTAPAFDLRTLDQRARLSLWSLRGDVVVVVGAPDALARAHVEAAETLVDGDFMRLWPHRHATDGFFAAVWQRR